MNTQDSFGENVLSTSSVPGRELEAESVEMNTTILLQWIRSHLVIPGRGDNPYSVCRFRRTYSRPVILKVWSAG